MRALVVYESMYGNTHEIAGNIADGLRSNYEVTLVPVAEATTDLLAGADLLVGGAPTHVHGLPSVATRRMAARAAAKDGSALRMDPDGDDSGLPEWLNDLGQRDGLAAAFDTRIKGVPVITGRASRAIARMLKRHGYRLVAAPESFLFSWETTLLDGEADRARRWA
jgi:Flavodoxin